MKRVTCFLLAILMLLGSTALAELEISNGKLLFPEYTWSSKTEHSEAKPLYEFSLSENAAIQSSIYEKSGNLYVGVMDGYQNAGKVTLNWNGVNYEGWHPDRYNSVDLVLQIKAQNNGGSVAKSVPFKFVSGHNMSEHQEIYIPEINYDPIENPQKTAPTTPEQEVPAEEINPVEEDEIEYEYIVVTPAPKKETYMHNNIRSFGPQVKELNAELTEKWFRITPVDLSEDGLQVFDMISGEYFVIGYVTVLVDGDTVTVERVYTQKDCWDWKENNYYTFFADLDSVYSVEPNEIKDEDRMEYKREYSIEKDLNGDTDVLLYMCNKATHTDDGKKLTPFRPKDPQNAEIIQAMADHILGLDIK